jgi:hypothetical protein
VSGWNIILNPTISDYFRNHFYLHLGVSYLVGLDEEFNSMVVDAMTNFWMNAWRKRQG